ncbi:hypothetical protein [Gordonia soli]|uniref:Glyoxalase-like domain-containing protein n=1 Tax=Gordonia soli NBRC 108243 TaxID=1223545 RepID=M0QF08_9ACTN|nr:hypothetical protein [Gordonia soli]GAC67195.1 hypothetical protein GS4_06_00410 [Gordonia soli NBRC 108243]
MSGDATAGLADLFERVTVMHATDRWADLAEDLIATLGTPKFSDDNAWAAWETLSLSDETDGPTWSLLARTSDLDAVATRAETLGWTVGEQEDGGHETRLPLRGPSGLAVIAYARRS